MKIGIPQYYAALKRVKSQMYPPKNKDFEWDVPPIARVTCDITDVAILKVYSFFW